MRILYSLALVAATAFAQGGFTGPGWYQITNMRSGRAISLAPGSRAVSQFLPRDSEDQAWVIEPGPGGTFFIRNGVNGMALQPTSGERSAQVVTAPFDGQPGQQWRMTAGKDGNAVIVNYYGRVLDIPDGAERDGVPLQIYDNNGDSNQRWILRPMRGEYGMRWRQPQPPPPGPGPGPRVMTCASEDGRRRWCDVDRGGAVRLVRQLSGAPCRENETWGRDERGVWVDRGCRADFEVGFAGPPRDNDRPNIVRCMSDRRERTYCEMDTRAGVRLVRQLEGPGCREGDTWGWDRRGIWVERGCRAEFEILMRR